MYKNIAIHIRGREDASWSEYLYTTGASSGNITLNTDATGLYVKVHPYQGTGSAYNGWWEFWACCAAGL